MLPPSQAASLSGINFGASPGPSGARGSDDFQFDGMMQHVLLSYRITVLTIAFSDK